MCFIFSIARSGYYAWLKGLISKQKQANAVLDEKIKNIFTLHRSRYGYLRMVQELREQGEIVSKNRVARRMKYLGLQAQAKKKFKATTDSTHKLPVAENLLNRDFNARSQSKMGSRH
jgi:putative transposase